jgi:hypothetical protein
VTSRYRLEAYRIERLFFDGVPEPSNGALQPDLSRPGFGVVFRRADAKRYLQKI